MMKGSINNRFVRGRPHRTCVACNKIKTKQELIRLVRVSDVGVEVDLTGNKSGRGAYLCPAKECWNIGLRGNRLEYVLRTTLTKDNREQLVRFGQDVLKE